MNARTVLYTIAALCLVAFGVISLTDREYIDCCIELVAAAFVAGATVHP